MTDTTGRATPVRVLPLGVDGILAEVADVDAALALHGALRALDLPGVVELVPAARTVAVRFEPGVTTSAALARVVRAQRLDGPTPAAGPLVVVPVVYDGADLSDVADRIGSTVDELVRRHAAPEYRVAFTGFAPGFAYLTGGDPVLDVPRRASPRTAIPAGAVAIAGGYSGVYPRRSPGGWHLLGHTDLPMWDPERRGAEALLQPGGRVRFRPVRPSVAVSREARHEAVPPVPSSARPGRETGGLDAGPALELLAPGLASTVQDLGRPGRAALGVARSGALDRAAHRRGNRLVGNDPSAATVEHLGGGLELRARGDLVVAVTGGRGPAVVVPAASVPAASDSPDRAIPHDRPVALQDGDVLVLGAPVVGAVTTIAVLGGVAVPPVLGSRSTDVLSGLGPAPLRAGAVLPVGSATTSAVADAPEPGPALPTVADTTTIRFLPGPRQDWIEDGVAALAAAAWTVTPRSNRVGVRLEGAVALVRAASGELASEATVPGAIQIPPEGQPVVFLADHPVTGGYPVVGVVVPEDLGRVAQVPIGGRIRFVSVPPRPPGSDGAGLLGDEGP